MSCRHEAGKKRLQVCRQSCLLFHLFFRFLSFCFLFVFIYLVCFYSFLFLSFTFCRFFSFRFSFACLSLLFFLFFFLLFIDSFVLSSFTSFFSHRIHCNFANCYFLDCVLRSLGSSKPCFSSKIMYIATTIALTLLNAIIMPFTQSHAIFCSSSGKLHFPRECVVCEALIEC